MNLRLALTTGALLCALPLAGAERRLRPGVFLYASPGLPDPNFAETVVLLLEHTDKGSLGVVVNRPTRIPVRELVPELAEPGDAALSLQWGGPVQPGAVLVLLRSPGSASDARRVLPGVHLCADLEDLKRAARQPDAVGRVRIYGGYTGWGAGQLENERRLGTWIVAPADAGSVFAADPEVLWRRVHDLLRRQEVRTLQSLPPVPHELEGRPPIRVGGPGTADHLHLGEPQRLVLGPAPPQVGVEAPHQLRRAGVADLP